MLIVGVGGTLRPNSTTELALRITLGVAEAGGAAIELFGAERLAALPMYRPDISGSSAEAAQLIAALRAAAGVVIASPGYHGTVSGLVKNAIDYVEELRQDERPYLSGRPLGCIASAAGWQAAVTTLTSLRTLAHALRAWPTPFGAAINTLDGSFDEFGVCSERVRLQLELVGREVVEFASRSPEAFPVA